MFKQLFSASLMAATLAAPSFAASQPAAAPASADAGAAAAPAKPAGKHSANPAAGPRGRSPERFVQRLEKDLKLTPEQTVKVREILAKDAPVAATGKAGKAGRLAGGKGSGPIPSGPAFAAQMRADNVDVAALDREWSQRAAQRQEIYAKMRDRFVALHDVLTPGQRAQLADRMERRGKAHHGEGRSEGRG